MSLSFRWLKRSKSRRSRGAAAFLSIGAFVFVLNFNALNVANVCFAQSGNVALRNVSKNDDAEKKNADDETPSAEPLSDAERDCGAIFDEYQNDLRKIAARCDERGMTLEAKITRSLLYEEEPFYFNAPLFPEKKNADALPDDATSEQRSWYSALRKLRKERAAATFELAKRYGKEKRGFYVVACALTTLFIDSDAEEARRFFGYSLRDGRWRTDWEIRQLEKGFVETEEFGWLPADRVERYRAGERYYKGEWVSTRKEVEAILNGNSGWKIETENFSILSRVSLERGVEIGRFLESYYQTWSRLFYRFIASEKRWAARLNADGPGASKRFKIILYRDRDEYLRELRKHDGNVEQSVGGYFPDMRCIFVYEPGPGDDFDLNSLLAHEATHQFFNERNGATQNASSRRARGYANLAARANFWAVEGVAVYMETYRPGKTLARLGGYRGVFRIECALESLFDDGSYIPLRRYAALSRRAFQEAEDLPLLYSQAAGLAFFFLHYRDGIYRNAFVAYLYLIYQGADAPNSLERLTNKSFEELDAEYAAFMKTLREN